MTIDQVAEMLGVQPGLLQPFAVADPFHDGLPLEGFLDMWRQLLERHPEAAALPERNGCSISFELSTSAGGSSPPTRRFKQRACRFRPTRRL